eukprot:scaffold193851_cov32-Prasinocladus_malaysianus.AAC.1
MQNPRLEADRVGLVAEHRLEGRNLCGAIIIFTQSYVYECLYISTMPSVDRQTGRSKPLRSARAI